MKRLATALLAVSLSACVSYQGYGYSDDGYYDDHYYEGPDDYRGSPARDRYYQDDGYDYAGYASFGYGGYPYYYSSLWPIYHGYYDPFYNPYFHYGVTYFPRNYFGFGYGGYAYPRYQPYAPYRYSWYDNYFDVGGYHDRRDRRRDHFVGQRSAFGSARNQAERMAAWTGADRVGQDNGRFRDQRSNEPGRRGQRGFGPGMPQRSSPAPILRGNSPAPRPRSRQFDRGGGQPVPQANDFRPSSVGDRPDRERGTAWQSEQRWPQGQGQGVGPASRDRRGQVAPTGSLPSARPTRGNAAPLTDLGGSAIPSRRGFRPASTPASSPSIAPTTSYGSDVRAVEGLVPRGEGGRIGDAQSRRYFRTAPSTLMPAPARGPIETRQRSEPAAPFGNGNRSAMPVRQSQPDFGGGRSAPVAPRPQPMQPTRSAPTPRPQRSRRDDVDADDGEQRRER